MIKIKIVNQSRNPMPEFATEGSAGVDLRAHLVEDICMKPLERAMVPTGLYVELPRGYEAQIRPRSGMAVKYGVTVLNTPGTVDSDYRGEIKVILVNLSNDPFKIQNGDRICQMVVHKYESFEWEEVSQLNTTGRGEGGFGHTGK
ncbi:MAG: dUTP diphosphatase [Bacteroidota bacterium]